MTPVEFDVYIHERGGRPHKVGTISTSAIPATWSHDNRVLYFVTADLSARTLTYSDVAPVAA